MQDELASGARFGRQVLPSPLCLVLCEFSAYIGSDMIQLNMLAVVEQYQTGIDWVPASMAAYLTGGMFLQWFLGPLSDRIGRRSVMLAGMVQFIVTCLAILLMQNIEQFTLLRFLQSISLCFIGTMGYAVIQESFEGVVCIKITALMTSMTPIVPLLGPLVGTAWIHVSPWKGMFILFATLAAISSLGLRRAMPETAARIGERLLLKEFGRNYKLVLKNGRFVAGVLALGFVNLPSLVWIAQSSVIIITGGQLSGYEYGLLQVPVSRALTAGNLLLTRLTSRCIVYPLIVMGGWPVMIGLLIAAAATAISSHTYLWMTAGLSIYTFGVGLANTELVWLALLTSDMSRGTTSAVTGMLQMLIFIVGVETSKHVWLNEGNGLLNLFNLTNGILWLSLMVIFLKDKQMGNSYEG